MIEGMNKKLSCTLAVVLLSLLAACAPRTQEASVESDALVSSPAAQETERVATAAFHRMELAQIEDGVYTTNVLINLDVPQGVRWMLEDLNDDDYTLRFTSTNVPGVAWIVTPDGVEPQRVEEDAAS